MERQLRQLLRHVQPAHVGLHLQKLPACLPACLATCLRQLDPTAAPAGLLKARRRLQEDGRVVNWLVHVANPALAAAFPPKLRGVLTTQRMDEEERNKWFSSRHHVDVGCPSLGSAAGSVTMPLQLRWF